MSVNSTLKKEGIVVVKQLDFLKVNTISRDIASKLCLAFPEHGLNKSDLFDSLRKIKMYLAKMPNDSFGAKYFHKNNSIYFNENIDIVEMANIAMHECIHHIQELRDDNNNVIKLGLYDFSSCLALNEAAVQLMASEANMCDTTEEKYYDVFLKTISPNYYPLECALVNQMAYFTGTYSLFHSVLNSNDLFRNTFIVKFDKKTYYSICKKLDYLLSLEDYTNSLLYELKYAESEHSIKHLTKLININKENISDFFFKTQNYIMKRCFTIEFNSIKNADTLKDFKQKIYNYKDVIGYNDTYTFYNDFYRAMMQALERKSEAIYNVGELNLYDNLNTSLMVVENSHFPSLAFVKTFIRKFRKLFNKNKETNFNDSII